MNSHGRQRRKAGRRRIRVVPVRRSNAIWTSGFVTVCVIRHLLSPLLISVGIIQYFEERGRERVLKGDTEGEARWVGGLGECFLTPKWLSQSGEGPIREQWTLGRPGINNTSLPQHVNHREQSEGFAETPLRRAENQPAVVVVVEAEVVSGVKHVVCPPCHGHSSSTSPWNKLCRPPLC